MQTRNLIVLAIRTRWPDPIELPNIPEIFGNPMRIVVKIVECNQAFDNFSDILLQLVEYRPPIRQFGPEFVRIPNEIEPKTSKQEAFSSDFRYRLLISIFDSQFCQYSLGFSEQLFDDLFGWADVSDHPGDFPCHA